MTWVLCGLWGGVCGWFSLGISRRKGWSVWKFLVLSETTTLIGTTAITIIQHHK